MAPPYATRAFLALLAATGGARAEWTRSCKSSETADEVLSGVDMTGKVVVISGADGNIATQVGRALALRNASVMLTCRSATKCQATQSTIAKATGGRVGQTKIYAFDLSEKKSIRDFAAKVQADNGGRIDVLINSAGMYGTFMTKDHLVGLMQVNLLGPALLTDLLLPSLRARAGHPAGRVVNVAAATYGTSELRNYTTVEQLRSLCTALDPKLNASGHYYAVSKFLMTHHALELAKREPGVAAFALNPGVAFTSVKIPAWLVRSAPAWLLRLLPPTVQHIHEVCTTNLAGFEACPEATTQAAGVISAAAAWPGIEASSGSYLDFDTTLLAPGAPHGPYGPWTQKEPTCVPRPPPPMDAALRSQWYDEMIKIMSTDSSTEAGSGAQVVV